jgi:hypothetical protein
MRSPETPDFKVTDRRQFRADGSPRDAEERSAPPADPAADTGDRRPVTFSGFVASLGAQALAAGTEGGSGLGAVREVVAILEMLKEKTEGRRSDDESRILDGVLFELRMTYVSRAGDPARTAPSATA